MNKIITTDDLMQVLCRHCDSHITECDNCGMRAIIDETPEIIRCKDCVKRPPATARNGDVPTSDCPLWCGYCFGINDNYGGEFFCGVGSRE